ncbi:hypothetical protein CsSME_00034896 [Camellia sinensis var. sinensis]
MDSQSPCLLVLFGKSSTEKELAKSRLEFLLKKIVFGTIHF